MTISQRLIRHIPTGQVIDIGRDVARADYALLASLHGQIARGDNVLECLTPGGGDPWLYVLPARQRRLVRPALPRRRAPWRPPHHP
jgi:hypothetical protein